jgi:ubiquinol-cytochrome c reductase cytochrome b subunit
MPVVGCWKLGHRFNVAFLFVMIAGASLLTYRAWWDDHRGADAEGFQAAVVDAEEDAHRAAQLAAAGIPPEGAITLVRHDAKIQGRKLFKAKCAQCHGAGAGKPNYDGAPKLERFASRDWLAGLLSAQSVDGPDYFGHTSHHDGDMVKFVKDDLQKWKRDEVESVILALSAEAQLPEQAQLDAADQQRIAEGIQLIKDEDRCAGCHKFYDAGSAGSAPDLTGYGSRNWLIAFIANPAAERFYGANNDRMPAFADHPPGSPQNQLTPQSVELLADWLRGDWNRGAADTGDGKSTK